MILSIIEISFFLESVVVDLQHLRVYIVFRFMTIFDDVDMNRFVIIRVKLEDISEYDKYRWHNVLRCINTKIQINGKLSTPHNTAAIA